MIETNLDALRIQAYIILVNLKDSFNIIGLVKWGMSTELSVLNTTLAYIFAVILNHLEDLFMKFSFLFQESPSISTVCVCV